MKIVGFATVMLAMALSCGWAGDEDNSAIRSGLFWQPGGAPQWQSFTEMNDHYEDEFVNSKGFGPSRMIRLEEMKEFEVAGKKFRVGAVQLVGIVDREKPAVYQTHAWMKKEMIKDAVSREPSKAESAALAKLRKGKEWVSLEGHENVIVGALRAKPSCTKCHEDAKSNQLLGAFRYQLVEVRRVNVPPVQLRESKQKEDKARVDAVPTT